MATALPAKGSTGRFGVDKCLEFFEENGDSQGTVILKSDQEPAIELLMKELVEAREDNFGGITKTKQGEQWGCGKSGSGN